MKRVVAIGTLLMVTLMLLSILSLNTFAYPTPQSPGDLKCQMPVLESQINSQSASLNRQHAVSLALQAITNASEYASYKLTLDSLFDRWSFSVVTCAVNWKSVDPVFLSISPNGSSIFLVVSENPNLNGVQNITQQSAAVKASRSNYNPWSGYEYNVQTSSVDANAQWVIPTASIPAGNPTCYNGNNYECVLAVWVGESVSPGLNGNFAQGGSNSEQSCVQYQYTFVCYSTYNLWYEFSQSGGQVSCAPANPGDTALADMSYYGGTDSIFVTDFSNGQICSTSQSESAPSYEQFIGEIPEWANCIFGYCYSTGSDYLPQFNQFSIEQATINAQPISGISNPNGYQMINGGNLNIQRSGVSYSGSLGAYFTQTWQTSAGT